jgi:hypothetical protein
MGHVVLRFGVTASKLESVNGDGEKFTVGHRVVPFYRTRIPISCGGRTLSHKRFDFQLESQIHSDFLRG